jgi:hypothetical protein
LVVEVLVGKVGQPGQLMEPMGATLVVVALKQMVEQEVAAVLYVTSIMYLLRLDNLLL